MPPAKSTTVVPTAADSRLREWELPERLAEYVTEKFFPVATRTLGEQWPVTHVIVHKRKLLKTAEVIDRADELMKTAVERAARGGKAPARTKETATV